MSEEKSFPSAMDAPDSDVTPLTLSMVGDLLTLSKQSPRKRMLQKVHKSHEASAHRMFNALQPGTYIPPHRHMNPEKDETLLVLAGSLMFIRFSDDGAVEEHLLLQPGTETFGIDVAPKVYHTFIPLKADTLVFECKTGPWAHGGDHEIPQWAPGEDSPEAETYLLNLLKDLAEQVTAAAEAAKKPVS